MDDRNANRTLELYIKVDYNDGDYDSSINRISPETLEKIMPLITAIKVNHGSYQMGGMVETPMSELYPEISKDVHNTFSDLCPYPEYGFHSIETITVCPLTEKVKLL